MSMIPKEPSNTEISFTVPLVPPSVNHYKNRDSRSGRWYVTKEAQAFKWAVKVYARGQSIKATYYQLVVTIFLGYKQRGDGDNFNKVLGDALKDAAVIHSDAAIKDWRVLVSRDWKEPRTEITVRALAKEEKVR